MCVQESMISLYLLFVLSGGGGGGGGNMEINSMLLVRLFVTVKIL